MVDGQKNLKMLKFIIHTPFIFPKIQCIKYFVYYLLHLVKPGFYVLSVAKLLYNNKCPLVRLSIKYIFGKCNFQLHYYFSQKYDMVYSIYMSDEHILLYKVVRFICQ